jgi:hypothetical protein
MMTLANYGIKSNKYKDPISAKSLNKSLQIRNRTESTLKHCMKTFHRLPKDKRNDIVGAIEEYYSRVPFNVLVWNTNQTKQCVVDSILSLEYGFNPYKAKKAFRTIEQMLTNLEYLPWHKEFTKIFTYSGGFKHNVSDPLVDADNVFKAAGFEQESDECPLHLVIHPTGSSQAERSDLLSQVIFDCMLAQVIMGDIIDVFENCCKTSKMAPNEVKSDQINCYTWIQHYFRERSHQISEKACSNIQELLNNVTNHLMKHKITSVKSSSSNERFVDEVPAYKKNDTCMKKDTGDTQQQQRRLLTSRSPENSDLFRLSDDLLKIPNYNESDNRVLKRFPTCYNESHFAADHTDTSLHATERYEGPSRDINASNNANRALRSISRPREMLDTPDNQLTKRNDVADFDHECGAPILRPDAPHNDRELLIPRQERKYAVSNQRDFVKQQDRSQTFIGSRQPYMSQVNVSPGRIIDQYGQHSVSGTSKSDHNEPSRFRNSPTSQQQQAASKSASSRYDSDSDQRRYDYRDDRPFSSRLYWSCNSCTFYNHASNEICEMCGNRKLL